jgi:hypothetical protein
MTERHHARETERLPEGAAQRLLARASELQAERDAELSIADLREAAQAAGIAPSAFERALAELRELGITVAPRAVPVPSRRRLAALWPVAAVAALLFEGQGSRVKSQGGRAKARPCLSMALSGLPGDASVPGCSPTWCRCASGCAAIQPVRSSR